MWKDAMGVEYVAVGDVLVIRVGGSLNHTSAEALREGACAILLRPQRTVLVNLEDVQQVDAAGLGALADVHRMATCVGGRLTLAAVQPRVREMLDVAGLTACFQIAASECDALEDFDVCVPN
jgi:anti-sigma B factor antagonist